MTPTASITDYRDWINQNLRPNVYAVGTLMQRRQCHDGAISYQLVGNADRYDQMYSQFIRRLSTAVYGRKHWRRYRELLPNCASLEGGTISSFSKGLRQKPDPHSSKDGVRFHINMYFRQPEWIPFDVFKTEVVEMWRAMDWTLPDIKVEISETNSVGYSLKEGPQTLLANSMSWPLSGSSIDGS